MSKESIVENYKSQHTILTNDFYAKKRSVGVTKQEQYAFDNAHGSIFTSMKDELIAGGYKIPKIIRNLAQEIDELKAEIEALKVK